MTKFEQELNEPMSLSDFMEELIEDNEAITDADLVFTFIPPKEGVKLWNLEVYHLEKPEVKYKSCNGWDTKKHAIQYLQTNELLLVKNIKDLIEKVDLFVPFGNEV